MRFRAHESFHIRKGWLFKGLKNVKDIPYTFLDRDNWKATEMLGLGTNMVKSLRYWMQATGLTTEPDRGISRSQAFTKFGDIVYKKDRYFEEEGTWWFIHYKLATNKEMATAWYWLFNEFKTKEFTKDEFINALDKYVKYHSESTTNVAASSLEGDYSCIVNTYISRSKTRREKISPEDNMDCPLTQLNLLDYVDVKSKKIKKVPLSKAEINQLIVLAVMLDQYRELESRKEIKISTLLNEPMNIGTIFNMDINVLNFYLDSLQKLGFLHVTRTAGLDIVRLTCNETSEDILNIYYNDENKLN